MCLSHRFKLPRQGGEPLQQCRQGNIVSLSICQPKQTSTLSQCWTISSNYSQARYLLALHPITYDTSLTAHCGVPAWNISKLAELLFASTGPVVSHIATSVNSVVIALEFRSTAVRIYSLQRHGCSQLQANANDMLISWCRAHTLFW